MRTRTITRQRLQVPFLVTETSVWGEYSAKTVVVESEDVEGRGRVASINFVSATKRARARARLDHLEPRLPSPAFRPLVAFSVRTCIASA